jgi:hypothetical protein
VNDHVYVPNVHYEDQAFLERQFPGLPGFPGIPGLPQFPGQPGLPPGSQAPTAPPPAFIPQQQSASAFAIDPGAISFCLFRNTFIWLNNVARFWYYSIFVGCCRLQVEWQVLDDFWHRYKTNQFI